MYVYTYIKIYIIFCSKQVCLHFWTAD